VKTVGVLVVMIVGLLAGVGQASAHTHAETPAVQQHHQSDDVPTHHQAAAGDPLQDCGGCDPLSMACCVSIVPGAMPGLAEIIPVAYAYRLPGPQVSHDLAGRDPPGKPPRL
jgi:hypothetical protein